MMPPARLTGARRSERAPAYGTRTLYLRACVPYASRPETLTTALPAVRSNLCDAPRRLLCRRTNGSARTRQARRQPARAGGKDVFDCRRIRGMPTSTEWPIRPRQDRPDGQFGPKRRAPPYCRGHRIPFTGFVNHGLHPAIHALQCAYIQHPDHRRLRRMVCHACRIASPGGASRRASIACRWAIRATGNPPAPPSSKCVSTTAPAIASITSGAERYG